MVVNEIRRRNLKHLIGDRKVSEFAREYDLSEKYIRFVLNGESKCGNRFARSIEEAHSTVTGAIRTTGWMDTPQWMPESQEDYPGVPVVGTAQAGDDGYWHELDHPVGEGEGFVRYPMKDPNCYALRIKGDSMWPRIRPGEFIVIEPNSPPQLNEEVMIQTMDGRSMVKILASRRGGIVELHSINGDHKPISFDEAQLSKLHYVSAILKPKDYYERISR